MAQEHGDVGEMLRGGDGKVTVVPQAINFKDYGSDLVCTCGPANKSSFFIKLSHTWLSGCLVSWICCGVQTKSSWTRQLLVSNRTAAAVRVAVVSTQTPRFKIYPQKTSDLDDVTATCWNPVIPAEGAAGFVVQVWQPLLHEASTL